jgi:hypothetical protein
MPNSRKSRFTEPTEIFFHGMLSRFIAGTQDHFDTNTVMVRTGLKLDQQ